MLLQWGHKTPKTVWLWVVRKHGPVLSTRPTSERRFPLCDSACARGGGFHEGTWKHADASWHANAKSTRTICALCKRSLLAGACHIDIRGASFWTGALWNGRRKGTDIGGARVHVRWGIATCGNIFCGNRSGPRTKIAKGSGLNSTDHSELPTAICALENVWCCCGHSIHQLHMHSWGGALLFRCYVVCCLFNAAGSNLGPGRAESLSCAPHNRARHAHAGWWAMPCRWPRSNGQSGPITPRGYAH